MAKLFRWLDKNILKLGIAFLLFFIPVWPKLPVLNVTHTWVYIRIEDFLVAALVGIFLVQFWRKKMSLSSPMSWPIFLYWLVGFTSSIFAIIFFRSLPNFFPSLVFLHFLRRIEYMILFFIVLASVISDRTAIKWYLTSAILGFLGVLLYGMGQKYFGFPAFLTMNEEFAKGIPLFLPPGARTTSTFAGHYDLAAYLMFLIVILGSIFFGLRKAKEKIFWGIILFGAVFLLVSTASRVSFTVYLITGSFMLWWQKRRLLIPPLIIFSLLLMNFMGGGVSERFAKTFRIREIVYDISKGAPVATIKSVTSQGQLIVESQEVTAENLPVGTGFIGGVGKTTKSQTLSPAEKLVAKPQEPAITTLQISTGSGEIATISGSFLMQKVIVYDVSFTTRFQGEWPRAWEAFKRNPLLGSGFSSISLATDNDYLRALGETGVLGLAAFLFIFGVFFLYVKSVLRWVRKPLSKNLVIGVTSGLFGLMINASLIDVFEASKVAFIVWPFMGMTVGVLKISQKERFSLPSEVKNVLLNPLTAIIVLFALGFFLLNSSFSYYFIGDDFTWLHWAASSTIHDIPSYFTQAFGFFYRPISKIFYFSSFALFWLKPYGYHFLSFFIHFGASAALYLLILNLWQKRRLAFLAALFFLFLPVHSESIFWTAASFTSMLGFAFGLWSLVFFARAQKSGHPGLIFLTAFTFALAIFTYEGVIALPLIFLWLAFSLGGKIFTRANILVLIFSLVIVGFYSFLRNLSGAHGLAGDYNYNFARLPFNFVGNLFGYLGLFLAGERFLPIYSSLRELLRVNLGLAALGIIIFTIVILGLTLSLRKRKIKISPTVLFALGFIPLSLLPFLGLGNTAFRFGYLASAGYALILAALVMFIAQKLEEKNVYLGMLTLVLVTLVILGFYGRELKKAQKDWQRASEITRNTLLALKSNYFPAPPQTKFYFLNVPIKNGQAWVFPVGLEDGVWHIFRDETIKVTQLKSKEEGLNLIKGEKNAHLLIFEVDKLKEVKNE